MMFIEWRLKPRMSRMFRDKRGNFAIMTALTLPVGIVAIGVGIDLSSMMSTKANLQNAADSAALAAASGMANKGVTRNDAILLVDDFVTSQIASDAQSSGSSYVPPTTSTAITETTSADGAKSFRVNVTTTYSVPLSPFLSLLNMTSQDVVVNSEAYASQEMKSNPISMYLILDKSGSMGENTDTVDADNPTKSVAYDCSYYSGWQYVQRTCYRSETNYILKIDALKTAVAGLMGQLTTADKNAQFVRTGVSTFASSMEKGTDLEWGTTTVKNTTNALVASGGTNSTASFQKAVQKVSSGTENTAHKQKNGGVPTKYIIFMTDGDNNSSSSDTSTKVHCDHARDAGIEVFTIGFMVATTRANDLLKYCATTASHYMSAKNAAELNDNFKTIGMKATQAMTRLTN